MPTGSQTGEDVGGRDRPVMEKGFMKRRVEIRKWLLEHGITQADIARETGASQTLVCRVIEGTRGAKKGRTLSGAINEWLRRKGCPAAQIGLEQASPKVEGDQARDDAA